MSPFEKKSIVVRASLREWENENKENTIVGGDGEESLKINRAIFMCGVKQFVRLILSSFNFSREMIF